MADGMINLTIDGAPVSVPPGTLVIEAAKQAGVLVPHYCYHPGLPGAGGCRMCFGAFSMSTRHMRHTPATRRPGGEQEGGKWLLDNGEAPKLPNARAPPGAGGKGGRP